MSDALLRGLKLAEQDIASGRLAYPNYKAELQAVTAFLGREIARLARPTAVFKPEGAGWAIGHPDGVHVYLNGPEALQAAYNAIAGHEVRAADFVRPGAKRASDSLRNRVRSAGAWIAEHTGCGPLADAFKHHMHIRGGMIVYDARAPGAPRIVTA